MLSHTCTVLFTCTVGPADESSHYKLMDENHPWMTMVPGPSVQLARFFCIYVCFYPARPHTVMLNVFLNQRTSNTCSLAGSAVTWFCRPVHAGYQRVHAGCQRVHTANNLYCCSLSGLHYILVGSLPLANNVQHCASYRTSCMCDYKSLCSVVVCNAVGS